MDDMQDIPLNIPEAYAKRLGEAQMKMRQWRLSASDLARRQDRLRLWQVSCLHHSEISFTQ
jgi:hypothetical protein